MKRRGPLLWLAARPRWLVVAVLLLPVLYVGAFGPMVWLYGHGFLRDDGAALIAVRFAYAPLLWIGETGPQPVRDAFNWYAELWAP